jgi:hypothetical protein
MTSIVRRLPIALLFILALTGAARAQQRNEVAAQIQQYIATVEQGRQILQSVSNPNAAGDAFSPEGTRVRWALATVTPIAANLTTQFAQLADVTDATTLERGYAMWQTTGQVELVDSLMGFGRLLVEKHITMSPQDAQSWQALAQSIGGVIQANGNDPERVVDLPRLKAEFWRLKFVHAARGATERLDRTQVAIHNLETRLAQEQEAKGLTQALQANIAAGKTDASLEPRIAALPEDLRASVEASRRAAEASKAQKLAQTQEDQRRQEASLKRQREIDEAIRLRKAELETGQTNPVAERQRQGDAGLAHSVKVWEEAYQQEQADKKAAEARRKLAEIERARAEEQQRRQAEATARRAEEEAGRRAAMLRKYDIKGTLNGYELGANPYQYRNQVMILRGARFGRMLSSSTGILVVGRDQEIYISKLPSDLFSRPNESAPLVVRVQGLASGTNALGAPMQVPHVEYVAVWTE